MHPDEEKPDDFEIEIEPFTPEELEETRKRLESLPRTEPWDDTDPLENLEFWESVGNV